MMGGGVTVPGEDDFVVVDAQDYSVVPNAAARAQETVKEVLEALRDRTAGLQDAIETLGQIVADGGVAGVVQGGRVLEQLGFLQPRGEGIPARVQAWYKAPAVVIAGIAAVSVMTYKVFEGIANAVWPSTADLSPQAKQIDIASPDDLASQRVKDTAVEVIRAPETSQDHIDARAERRRNKKL